MISLSISVSPGLQVQVCGVDGVGEGDVGGGALVVVGGRLAAGLAAAPGNAGAGSGRRASCAPSSAAASAAGHVAGFLVPALDLDQKCQYFYAYIMIPSCLSAKLCFAAAAAACLCLPSFCIGSKCVNTTEHHFIHYM